MMNETVSSEILLACTRHNTYDLTMTCVVVGSARRAVAMLLGLLVTEA